MVYNKSQREENNWSVVGLVSDVPGKEAGGRKMPLDFIIRISLMSFNSSVE